MSLKRLTKFVSKGYDRNPKTLYDQIRVKWIPILTPDNEQTFHPVFEIQNEGKWLPVKSEINEV